MLNLKGPGAPPKDKRSITKARSSCVIWVTVLMALSQLRYMRRYANLISTFFAGILQLGYFLLAATVQSINLVRHLPNLHCWRRSVLVRKLTLVPDLVHLKLWSWVSLSFGTILPRSLIIHCGWMFNGAMQMPGSLVILLRRRGRAYP